MAMPAIMGRSSAGTAASVTVVLGTGSQLSCYPFASVRSWRKPITQNREGLDLANSFGMDILIQAQDPPQAARFYVDQLGFKITDANTKMIALHGKHINLFIEPGPALGPVLEVSVDSVEEAKVRLARNGCQIIKDEPEFPRCYVKDPYGLIYNLTR
jgi:predicted enzyme related to lactoylglutathione lyase